jgi:hypothetical protein
MPTVITKSMSKVTMQVVTIRVTLQDCRIPSEGTGANSESLIQHEPEFSNRLGC